MFEDEWLKVMQWYFTNCSANISKLHHSQPIMQYALTFSLSTHKKGYAVKILYLTNCLGVINQKEKIHSPTLPKMSKRKSLSWLYYTNSHLMCLWPCLARLALSRVPLQYQVLTCGVFLKTNIKGQFVSGRPGGGETAQILKIQDQSSPRNVDSPTEATIMNAAIDMDEQVHLWSVDLESYGHIPTHGRAESHGHSLFSFLEALPHWFPWWLHKFTLSQSAHKGSCLPISSLSFAIILFLDDSHSE